MTTTHSLLHKSLDFLGPLQPIQTFIPLHPAWISFQAFCLGRFAFATPHSLDRPGPIDQTCVHGSSRLVHFFHLLHTPWARGRSNQGHLGRLYRHFRPHVSFSCKAHIIFSMPRKLQDVSFPEAPLPFCAASVLEAERWILHGVAEQTSRKKKTMW